MLRSCEYTAVGVHTTLTAFLFHFGLKHAVYDTCFHGESMTFALRNFHSSDLEGIVSLINAADSFHKTQEGTSAKELDMFLSSPGLEDL
jgi:hypothetical protein